MHYLIQKTTRQHIAVADDMPCPVECVKVRADRNGWVVYHGVVCPVPTNSRVDICTMDGKVFAGMLAWDVKWSRVSDYRPECDTIMARAGETAPNHTDGLDHVPRYQADDLPATTAPGHETAAMLLSVVCAFAIGALIGWGWM
jgi:hypothetical protein